jgi:hypothetical protein
VPAVITRLEALKISARGQVRLVCPILMRDRIVRIPFHASPNPAESAPYKLRSHQTDDPAEKTKICRSVMIIIDLSVSYWFIEEDHLT